MRSVARFAVSGAPGGGKTTVLDELRSRGYVVVPESAREIIRTRKERGLSPRPEPVEFADEILKSDLAKYAACADEPVLFDRSYVDGLGMVKSASGLSEEALASYLERYPLHPTAFVFPAWREIYTADEERDQTFAEAETVFASVVRWYEMCGFDVTIVPKRSVNARADFIAEVLSDRIRAL